MTDSTPARQQPGPAAAAAPEPAPAEADFPPQEIGAFLRFCAGEWMGLRSRFALGEATAMAEGDAWHSSERGELVVAYLEPGAGEGSAASPGGLSVGAKGEQPCRLLFSADGAFSLHGGQGPRQGRWQLWPDGSLELIMRGETSEVRERIWFTKPNLRLRSTVEHHADGSPGRASFSSEIRRVSRPAAPAS
jgi:hypothetical protein